MHIVQCASAFDEQQIEKYQFVFLARENIDFNPDLKLRTAFLNRTKLIRNQFNSRHLK